MIKPAGLILPSTAVARWETAGVLAHADSKRRPTQRSPTISLADGSPKEGSVRTGAPGPLTCPHDSPGPAHNIR